MSRLLLPDEVLLRRFGFVRAVGGLAYVAVVAVLFVQYGVQVWPLLIGVPVLAVVTTWYFQASLRQPRLTTVVSLLADLLVLSGAVAFVGGTGSGLVMVHTIVIVSAGILLGPLAAKAFTAFAVLAGLAQVGVEQLGLTPALLHRPDLAERLPVLAISLAVLMSVGFLTDIYASRLHELVAEAGAEADAVRRHGRRRRWLVRRASVDVREPLQELEAVAAELDRSEGGLEPGERERLAARLRLAVADVDTEVGRLADLGGLGPDDARPEPLSLRAVVDDCLAAVGDRLAAHHVDVDVPSGLKVLGDRRGARRVVLTLLENVAEHTPPGTTARVHAVSTGGWGMLAVTDDGPGLPEDAQRLFEPSDDVAAVARVGLPMVAELCRQMGARCRCEPAPGGGARFMVSFRLAPSGAPAADGPMPVEPPTQAR